MREQITTIREALKLSMPRHPTWGEAIKALTQLEAMVGAQEPVAWVQQTDAELTPADAFSWVQTAVHNLPLYTAAPVAQQPSKATLEKLRAWEASGELIDRAWQVLQSQEQEIMRLEKMLAEERAQQPQADTPQATTIAEAARDVGKWLNERPNRPIDLRHVAMLVAHAMQPQAEAVPTIYASRGQLENLKPDPEDEAGTYLPVRKTPKGKFTHPLFAAPQQAEAVPSDVVRDAERWRTFLATRPANTHAVINDAIDAVMAKGEKS